MKFIPNKLKFKKYQKGKKFNMITKPTSFIQRKRLGVICLKALESSRLSSTQLQAFFKSIRKVIKKSGKITLKTFPHTPITKKPLEVRMGKGKGPVSYWISKVSVGIVLCEIQSKKVSIVKKALLYTQIKLPFKTKIYIY